jgi:hypothetical protein
MRKGVFLLSAAIVLAGTASVAVSAAQSANLRLPPPKSPKDQIYSPGAIDKSLKRLGYRVEKMKRKGTTYSVRAVGKSGNRVQLIIDGRSGAIIGLAVLQAAPGQAAKVAAAIKSRRGSRYVDDSTPFGIIIPDTYQFRWTVIPNTVWTVYTSDYIYESWSYVGSGYRFAVPYYSVRPGHNDFSVTTISVSGLNEPIYDVYDYQGTEISTSYSEEDDEIAATQSFEDSWGALNDQIEETYLDGAVDGIAVVDADEISDFDSEDGDFDIADDPDDDYDADGGDEDDDDADGGDEDDDDADRGDEDDAGADEDEDSGDDGGHEDDSEDEYEDDGGDEDYDDGGEPEMTATN